MQLLILCAWHCKHFSFFLYSLTGFRAGASVKDLPTRAGDVKAMGLIAGYGRSPGEGNGNPLQYSCLENPIDSLAGYSP